MFGRRDGESKADRVEDAQPTCSFCNKSKRDEATLIAGPDVYICEECVEVCVNILADGGGPSLVGALEKAARFRSSPVSRTSGATPCGICGTPVLRGDGLVIEGRGVVCLGCAYAVARAIGPAVRRMDMLNGVVVRDGTEPGGRNALDFDLRDVLEALGPRASASRWRCSGVRYVSADDQDIEAFERSEGRPIEGAQLLLAATERLQQVIDGHFEAFENTHETPWVIVRAVDSAWWEVLSDDPAVLNAVRGRFRVVEDRPPRSAGP